MKTIHSLFLVCVLILGACGAPTSAPTAELAATDTATPLPVAISTLTPVPIITETTVPPAAPEGFSPILYGRKFDKMTFILLGGVEGEGWLTPEMSAARFTGPLQYDIHTFRGESVQLAVDALQFSPPSKGFGIRIDSPVEGSGIVGVAQGWQVLKRDVEELASDNDFYEQVVMDWLKAKGVTSPQLGVLHVFRVDIEGDSVDEIFINATHLDESQHTTQAGDHSIVLMRKVVGNDAITLPVVEDIYDSQEPEITYPTTYSLGNFLDLNQDGVLEVIVDTQAWEKFGAIIYQIKDGNVIQVLP